MKGAKIEEDSGIAADAVVTKDIDSGVMLTKMATRTIRKMKKK